MRVYEIAKEIGIPNKDLIAKIRALGLEVNNHMSSLDADDVARIKRSLEKEKGGTQAPAETKRIATTDVAAICNECLAESFAILMEGERALKGAIKFG